MKRKQTEKIVSKDDDAISKVMADKLQETIQLLMTVWNLFLLSVN